MLNSWLFFLSGFCELLYLLRGLLRRAGRLLADHPLKDVMKKRATVIFPLYTCAHIDSENNVHFIKLFDSAKWEQYILNHR